MRVSTPIRLAGLVSSVFVGLSHAGPSCDNEAGQVCPSSMGKEIGICLQDPSKHQITDIDGNPRELEPGEKPMELSNDCLEFIKINTACDKEISEHCQEMYFHGDTMTCLTTWTKPDVLSEGCRAALPKKEEEEKEDASKAEWRAKRKAAREEAMKAIEREKGSSTGKGKKKNKKEL
eukprot:TRINITY_DN2192_c0_g1_i2.p1 TRINITY_DN2192_c0_g1~~TRINITY_DN2192_c0_g1_i2.p1  ORF type:complete len:177 (-),score=49.48 TRINITY_DN2192_c0_g1_i2:162-692(-)